MKTQHFTENGGIYFLDSKEVFPFSDYFKVRVGAVLKNSKVYNGVDNGLTEDNPNNPNIQEFVYSKTQNNLGYDYSSNDHLLNNTELLSNISSNDGLLTTKSSNDETFKKIDLHNNEWIREWHGKSAVIFVNCKTRAYNPFFCTNSPKAFDGSVLGLYPTQKAIDRFETSRRMVSYLNFVDWRELGLKESGRYCFTQSSLQGCLLPKEV